MPAESEHLPTDSSVTPEPTGVSAARRPTHRRHALVRYTIGRVVLFGIWFLALWLLRVDLLWAVIIAALGSAVTSYFLLAPLRESAALDIERTVAHRSARSRAAEEDAYLDEE